MGIGTGNDTEGVVADEQEASGIIIYYLKKGVDLIPSTKPFTNIFQDREMFLLHWLS